MSSCRGCPIEDMASAVSEDTRRAALEFQVVEELEKFNAPAIDRALQFMEIQESYPNKESRMCALEQKIPCHWRGGWLTDFIAVPR